MKVLDLGCGLAKEENAFGIDLINLPGVDLVWNLNKFPYPFKSNSQDKVILSDVIEHLDNPIAVIRECHRLLKSNGELFIKVVYWNHKYSYSDPQHKWAFSELWFQDFLSKGRNYSYNFHFSECYVEFIYDNEATKRWGNNEAVLQQKAYFHCNVIQGMNIKLRK